MRFNYVPGDRQAQTGPLLSFSLLIPALIEVFENILDLPGRNARAIIRDPDFDRSGIPAMAFHGQCLHPNLATSRRKPQSIAQKIAQDLLNPALICQKHRN